MRNTASVSSLIASRSGVGCIVSAALGAILLAAPCPAQQMAAAMPGAYALKIYRTESGLYPFVQVYVRTFDSNKLPLVNLNAMNVGVMVAGRSYDPKKGQYVIQSLRQRPEGTRTVIVLDASKSMAGPPFEAALKAAARYIDSKRQQDEVAVLAIRDENEGYQIISQFERDPLALGRRLADTKADGLKTRLYDTIGAAMQMCGMTSQGAVEPGGESYTASCSVLVFSDGKDEGSALSREELNGRITSLQLPIPIYSVAYSKTSPEYFKNLEALSKNSFGKYYGIGEAIDRMQGVVEEVQNIIQSDYVVTFRSYLPIDGGAHPFKVGIEYPSGSGKFTYESSQFEAIQAPPVAPIKERLAALREQIQELPDKDPYFPLE